MSYEFTIQAVFEEQPPNPERFMAAAQKVLGHFIDEAQSALSIPQGFIRGTHSDEELWETLHKIEQSLSDAYGDREPAYISGAEMAVAIGLMEMRKRLEQIMLSDNAQPTPAYEGPSASGYDVDVRIREGLLLFTKDGRFSGNAIVMGPSLNQEEGWICRTDFGNRIQLTSQEIYTHYHLKRNGEEQEQRPAQWIRDRNGPSVHRDFRTTATDGGIDPYSSRRGDSPDEG